MGKFDYALQQIRRASELLLPQASFLNPTARALSHLNTACQELESLKRWPTEADEMSRIDDTKKHITDIAELLNDMYEDAEKQGYKPPLGTRSTISAHFLALQIQIGSLKAEQVQIKKGKWPTEDQVQAWAQKIFDMSINLGELKVDQWEPAPMRLQGVACVNPDCDYEFVAGTAGRVLQCPECAAQQIPFAPERKEPSGLDKILELIDEGEKIYVVGNDKAIMYCGHNDDVDVKTLYSELEKRERGGRSPIMFIDVPDCPSRQVVRDPEWKLRP